LILIFIIFLETVGQNSLDDEKIAEEQNLRILNCLIRNLQDQSRNRYVRL